MQVQALASAASRLLTSPRPRDSDGGARILVLLAQKYVLGLGWRLATEVSDSDAGGAANGATGGDGVAGGGYAASGRQQCGSGKPEGRLAAGVAFLDDLCDRLQVILGPGYLYRIAAQTACLERTPG